MHITEICYNGVEQCQFLAVFSVYRVFEIILPNTFVLFTLLIQDFLDEGK